MLEMLAECLGQGAGTSPAAAAESHNASLETESQNEGSLRNLRGSI